MFKTILSSLSLLTLLIGCGKGNPGYQPFETLDGVGANAPLPESQSENLKSVEFLKNSLPGVEPSGKQNSKFYLLEEKGNRVAHIALNSEAVEGDHRARIQFNEIAGQSISGFKYMYFHTQVDRVISKPHANNLIMHFYISLTCDENDPQEREIMADYTVTDDSAGLNMGPGPLKQMNRYQTQVFDKVFMAMEESDGSGLPHYLSGAASSLNTIIGLHPNACFSNRGIELVFGEPDASSFDEIKLDDVSFYFDHGPDSRLSFNYDFEEEVPEEKSEEKSYEYLSSLD